MTKRRIQIIVLMMALCLSASAAVRLPAVLGSNMVLQQQSEVCLWGWTEAGKTVKVSVPWEKKPLVVKADNKGRFTVKTKTPAAGGPYDIIFNDGEQRTLRNVLIGEVWLCSGQSNMEMPMRGFDRQPLRGANEVVSKAKARTPIRMFITDSEKGHWIRQYSKEPQEDIKGEWLENTPEGVASCSATAYYFARYLEEVLEVPVGVMVSTLGGARIEPFMSREAVASFNTVRNIGKLQGEVKEDDAYNVPTLLYNAKIAPLTSFPVRGFLWYQGESNRDNAAQYADLMLAMAKDWRTKWGAGDKMPFYFVEIAPYNYEGADGTSAALLREAQTKAMRQIPNSGIVSTLDIGAPNFIHPMDKKTVGNRLALLALAETYNRHGFGYASPVYQSMEVKDGRVYINVENADNGLCPMWTSLKGFEVAGEDRIFYPAYAEVETKTCRLAISNVKVPNPVAVRYCFKNYVEASVFNIYGFPLLPFRTDNWEAYTETTSKEILPLWPDGAPNSNGKADDEPTLTVYHPQCPNGKAIVMCPGGGYGHLALTHEGHDMAKWMTSMGVTYCVLKYRLPHQHHEVPRSDAEQAIRIVRNYADKWSVDPNKVGIMGGSAGGHLAASLATLYSDKAVRPDFQILLYPVISMDERITNKGTHDNLIGEYPPKKLLRHYSLHYQVNKDTPPAFIALSADDTGVVPENAELYKAALERQGIPVEMHVYPTGGHGWGYKDSFKYKQQWTKELEHWLGAF